MLIAASEPVPEGWEVVETVQVSPIDLAVAKYCRISKDQAQLHDAEGKLLFDGDKEEMSLALGGGGKFNRIAKLPEEPKVEEAPKNAASYSKVCSALVKALAKGDTFDTVENDLQGIDATGDQHLQAVLTGIPLLLKTHAQGGLPTNLVREALQRICTSVSSKAEKA